MNLKQTVNDVVKTLTAAKEANVKDAAANRDALIELQARIETNLDNQRSLADMTAEFAKRLTELSANMTGVCESLEDAFSGATVEVPSGPLDDFIGFCADCGAEIHATDAYIRRDGDTIVCPECASKADDVQ